MKCYECQCGMSALMAHKHPVKSIRDNPRIINYIPISTDVCCSCLDDLIERIIENKGIKFIIQAKEEE